MANRFAIAEEPTNRFAIDEPEVDDREQRRSELFEKIVIGEFSDIVTQSNIAKELIDSLDNPADVMSGLENGIMLGALFDISTEDAILLSPGIIKELYGKSIEQLSNAVINRKLKDDINNALKETPLNLKIGTIGLAASTLEAIKRRSIQLAGGGIFDDKALLRQFEAVTPPLRPGRESFKDPGDANNFVFDDEKLDFIRPDNAFGANLARRSLEELRGPLGRAEDVRLPGAIAAEAVGLITRIPDIGAKILRSKQKALQAEQDIATMANAPITKLMRTTVQSGVPSMSAAVGISLLTGNPLVGLVMLGESEGGAAFQTQLDEGGSIQKALIIGELSGAAEIGGEMLVFPKILRGFQEGLSIRRALTLIAENATQEGVTGFNQTFLQVFGTETTKGTDKLLAAKKAFVAGYKAIPENAFVGGAIGGAGGAAGVAVNVGRNILSKVTADQVITQVESDITVEETGIPAPTPPTEAPAAVQKPSIAEQRRALVERKLRAGEEVSPRLREDFADLVAEIEEPPTEAKGEGITGVIKNEIAGSGRTGEDIELKPDFAKEFVSVAMLQGNKVIKPLEGEINHAQIAERLGFPDDLIPGFIDKNDNFVFQFEADVPSVQAVPVSPKQAAPAQPPTEAKAVEAGKVPALAEKVAAKELPAKAPPVKPVPAVKIVSPGQAGPLQITFKATAGLPATRIVVDPKVARSIQVAENKIADLKTKLRQAQADKKVAVVKATQIQIDKAELQIEKLKQRQQIKLADTIEKGKVRVAKLRAAKEFSDKLRRDAISMVRAIPKDIQKDFFRRASEVTTLKGINKLAAEIEAGIERIEKREAIKGLNTAIKALNPKKMLPEFAGPAQAIIDSLQLGKLKEDTVVKNSDIKNMAQQVLDSAPRDEQGRIVDSIATFKAQQILDELRTKTTKTFAINQLSLEALEQITDTLIALRFQNTVDTIAAQQEKATEAIRRRKLIKEQITELPPGAKTPAGAVVRKIKLIHDNLESVTDAVGGARPGTYDLWKERLGALTEFVYNVLDRGVDNQARHNKQAGDILRDILKDNGVTKKEIISWSIRPGVATRIKDLLGISVKPKLHTFTLEDARGKTTDFDFTVNELMSIFMHTRNSHNLAVILNDGVDQFIKGKITKGEITKQKQKIRGFTIEIIDNMIASLTDQQKNVARQVGSKLMDGFNRDGINQTSVKLVGFNIATVERYWPARRSIIRTLKGEALRPALSLLENMGILKERVGIGNPIRLIGFFETTHASNRNVSTYVGLGEPLREAKAVLSTDVLAEMEDAGRGAEKDRILKHIIKIEGQLVPVFETELEEIVAQMIGGFAKSKLFLNAKIAPRQQISEFLISAYVDPKYMAAFKGVSSKVLISEIVEISPQMQARIEGFQFDRDIGDAFQQNELLNYLTGDLSLIDKTGLGMRFFDTNAIVDIYRATKAEVSDKNPGIDIKSDEGKALLKNRYEWVVRHSQPVWHVKDRSLLGASRNPLVRTMTMFMSQREQIVRMVNNGISDFANSEKTSVDTARLGRVLGTVALNLVAFTVYNFAWALLIQRKKKDVEELVRDFMRDILSLPFFGKYLAKSFEITFNSLTGRPVFSQQFDDGAVETILKEILVDAIPNFARAGQHFVTGEKYQRGPNRGQLKWENELLVAIDSLVDAFASLKGIPYYGAKDIVRSAKAQLPKE